MYFRITIDSTSKDTTIIVKSVERGDSGKYTLTLTNTSGAISSWGDVLVLGMLHFLSLKILSTFLA